MDKRKCESTNFTLVPILWTTEYWSLTSLNLIYQKNMILLELNCHHNTVGITNFLYVFSSVGWLILIMVIPTVSWCQFNYVIYGHAKILLVRVLCFGGLVLSNNYVPYVKEMMVLINMIQHENDPIQIPKIVMD